MTSILYRLKLGEVVATVPTIGFHHETLHHNGVELDTWDLGCQSSAVVLRRDRYNGSHAVIYVVDSTAARRMDAARTQLHELLQEPGLAGTRVLVLANKQDLPSALETDKIAAMLNLEEIHGHEWHIQACSAVTGDGLLLGMDWLVRALKNED